MTGGRLVYLCSLRGWEPQVTLRRFDVNSVQHVLLLGGDLVRLRDVATLNGVEAHQQRPEDLLELMP